MLEERPFAGGAARTPEAFGHDRVLINAIHGRSGGGITYLRNMLPYLAADGRFVVDLVLLEEQIERLQPIDAHVNLTVVNPPGGFFGRLIWEQIEIPRLAKRLGAKVTLSPANYGPIFAPRPVLVLQNALAVAAVEPRFTKRLYWHALALVTAVCVLTCSRAIVATEYMRRTLPRAVRRRGVDKIAVVPMGVEPFYTPTGQPTAESPFILAVGDIYVQKNYHSLVRAFAIVAQRNTQVKLKIVGRPIDQEYLELLKEQVEKLKLGGRVEFAGELPKEKVLALYRSATVFVLPSTVESFGLTLLEAMACGTAVASSRTAAMPEVAGDAALYFDPENPADIAEKLLQLLAQPSLRQHLSTLSVKRARGFSWRSTGQRTVRVILAALGQTAPTPHAPLAPPHLATDKLPQHAFTLLFLDDLRVENGYLDCIDALTEVFRRHPNSEFRLILAGHMAGAVDDLDAGEDPPARLTKRLRYDGLENVVEIVGPADGNLRAEFLEAADVLVRPAWGALLDPEPIFAEAASAGLPWIATRPVVDRLDPALQTSGICIEAGKPLAIADAVSEVFGNQKRYRELAAAVQLAKASASA
jgi:glycosyltransferase involved in cell wall biosynthesis